MVTEDAPPAPAGCPAGAAYGAPQLVTVLCGFLAVCTGVVLLQLSRVQQEPPRGPDQGADSETTSLGSLDNHDAVAMHVLVDAAGPAASPRKP